MWYIYCTTAESAEWNVLNTRSGQRQDVSSGDLTATFGAVRFPEDTERTQYMWSDVNSSFPDLFYVFHLFLLHQQWGPYITSVMCLCDCIVPVFPTTLSPRQIHRLLICFTYQEYGWPVNWLAQSHLSIHLLWSWLTSGSDCFQTGSHTSISFEPTARIKHRNKIRYPPSVLKQSHSIGRDGLFPSLWLVQSSQKRDLKFASSHYHFAFPLLGHQCSVSVL